MSEHPLPPEGEAWLRDANANMRDLDPAQRREVLDSLRAHILDALESGESIEVVLARLGSPDLVAEENGDRSIAEQVDRGRGRRYWDLARGLQIAAFVLTLAGILAVGFLPIPVEVTYADGEFVGTTHIGVVSVVFWSPYFLGAMLAATILTFVPIVVRRGRFVVAVVTTTMLLVVTVLGIAGGGNWLLVPPALSSVMATVLLAARRPHRRSPLSAGADLGFKRWSSSSSSLP